MGACVSLEKAMREVSLTGGLVYWLLAKVAVRLKLIRNKNL